LQELWPVWTKNGYMFVDIDADGNALPLQSTKPGIHGGVFVLKFESLAAKIGPRLPGAFRGY